MLMVANFWPWLAGAFLFLFISLLSYFNSPRWLLRLLGALLSYVVTVYITLIFGWYIALSDVASLLILILAAIFGALVLPRFAPQRSTKIKYRWLAIIVTTLLFFALPIYSFSPDKNLQNLSVQIYQMREGREFSEEDFRPDEVQFLKSHGVVDLDQLASSNINYGPNTPEAEVHVIFREKSGFPIQLNQPKQTRLLYLQTDKGWESYPPGTPTIDKKIFISTDLDIEFK
jgi:hypothetical protein